MGWEIIATRTATAMVFSNQNETAEGTDPNSAASFPDHDAPVMDYVKWVAGPALQGMVYDDGMGVAAVWLQNPAGQRWPATMLYSSHFRIDAAAAAATEWLLVAEDKAGNRTTLTLRP